MHVDRAYDQLAQHGEIDVGKALHVEAALARLVQAEPFQQLSVSFGEAADEDEVADAWRKGGERAVAFAAARITW